MHTLPLRYRSDFPFGSIFRDLERWMREDDEGFLGNAASPLPNFDMQQDKDAYHLTAELPGFSESEVKLDVHKGVVTVSGQRNVEVPAGFRATRRERGVVKFSRSVRLPDEVNEDGIKAQMKDGVLSIALPKRPEVKPRQIQIQGT
jgi:HSP20 family protein